jgi:Ser/Thr protein kinase RdoA (MazF antagonist)
VNAALPPLEPELRALLETRHAASAIDTARRAPLTPADSATSAALERIVVQDADGQVTRYVVKRLAPLGDWLARATDDRYMREHQLAASEIFEGLPAGVSVASLGSALLADGGAALLMRDVGEHIPPAGDAHLTHAQLRIAMVGLARLHATYARFPAERAAQLGLNTLEHWLTPLAPCTARREANHVPRDHVTPLILPGWRAFADLAPDAWTLIEPLLVNPAPVADALRQLPATLVHGDAKATNLAFEGDTLTLLDWSTTTVGPGALDPAWFVCINAGRLPVTKAAVLEQYRAERARLGVLPADGNAWERELALALLTSTMRLGWLKALQAQRSGDMREVMYWADAALAARQWL